MEDDELNNIRAKRLQQLQVFSNISYYICLCGFPILSSSVFLNLMRLLYAVNNNKNALVHAEEE